MGPDRPSVRVSGPPNRNFLSGYPGISATIPRIEGRVEIFPGGASLGPIEISFVRICLQRRESIHPSADKLAKKHLGAPRRDLVDVIGREVTLFKCRDGKQFDTLTSMCMPFMIPIPFGRGGEEVAKRIPPASIQLPHRVVETKYELVVTVQQGPQEQFKVLFPVPISRFDTISTFGMYNKPEHISGKVDHWLEMLTTLPRWSYGPGDEIMVYINIRPCIEHLGRMRRVVVQKISTSIEETITFNPEGDEPSTRVKVFGKKTTLIGHKMTDVGYMTNVGCHYPTNMDDMAEKKGILKPRNPEFPMHEVNSFTATGTLYKIEFYLNVKAHLENAKDIHLKMPIVVCPMSEKSCKEEMDAIEEAAREASLIDPNNPMLPAPIIVKPGHPNALRPMGFQVVGGDRRLLID